MKVSLVILFCTSLVNLNPDLGRAQEVSSAPIPTVKFCDLVRNPRHYDNKILRLKAILVENDRVRVDGADPYLYDPGCTKNDFTVLAEWSESFDWNSRTYKLLERIQAKIDKRGNSRARVTLVGEFNASDKRRYGHLDWADSQFVIHAIEKAVPVPADVGWPKRFKEKGYR